MSRGREASGGARRGGRVGARCGGRVVGLGVMIGRAGVDASASAIPNGRPLPVLTYTARNAWIGRIAAARAAG